MAAEGTHFNDLSIDKAKEVLDYALNAGRPAFITGPPGIGKSEMCYQIAEDNGRKLTEARLILMEPIDLRGLPSVKDTYIVRCDEEVTKAVTVEDEDGNEVPVMVTDDNGNEVPATTTDTVNQVYHGCRLLSDNGGKMSFIAPRLDDKGKQKILQLEPGEVTHIEVEGLSKWNKPDWFPVEDGNKHLLLLDEINGASPSVQAAAYEIVWNNRIGEHVLPRETCVWAAGNRAEDRAVVHQTPSPLRSRWITINLQVNPDVWKDWAWKNDVDERVIGFISFQQDALMIDSTDELQKQSYPCPRSWVMLSSLIKDDGGIPKELLAAMTAGTVGEGVAANFLSFMDTHASIPDIDDILSGKIDFDFPVDESPAYKWALCCAIAARARTKKGEKGQTVKKRVFAIYEFANTIPDELAEFGALIGIETFGVNDQLVKYISDKSPDNPFKKWNSKYIDYFRDATS
ncbi:MAG: hypothetical protein CMB80_05820 [Flammeovirgaceae bacterium]|nr:hypothetical protein [Flammeovirgaceae bacterium]|tara:strand:+ start:2320 stop:3693 length:1374 start_codon:yes stop_codon:yes gene_type:complete